MTLIGNLPSNTRMFGDPFPGGGGGTPFGDVSATPNNNCKYAYVKAECTVSNLGTVAGKKVIPGKTYIATLVVKASIEVRCSLSADCAGCKKYVTTELVNPKSGERFVTEAGQQNGLLFKFYTPLGCCNCAKQIVLDHKNATIEFKTTFLQDYDVDKITGVDWHRYFTMREIGELLEDWVQGIKDLEDPCGPP